MPKSRLQPTQRRIKMGNDALNNFGKNVNKSEFESKTEYVRDHAFFKLGAEIGECSVFRNKSGVHSMYKTPEFPSMSQAFQIDAILCRVDGFIEPTAHPCATEAERLAVYAHYLNNSFLRISLHDKMLMQIPLRELSKITVEANPNKTLGQPEYRIVEKFADIYTLPEPLKIPSGVEPMFNIIPAKSVRVSAADAIKQGEGYYPDCDFVNDRGFAMFFQMETRKIQEA